MWTAFKNLMGRVPDPWRPVVTLACVFVIGIGFFSAFNRMMACRYDASHEQYEQERAQWVKEKQQLLTSIAVKQAKIDELQPQILAYEQLAEDKKKLDEGIAARIDQTMEDFQREQQNTDAPVDCRTRAGRVHDKYGAAGIPIDLDALVREYCAGQ